MGETTKNVIMPPENDLQISIDGGGLLDTFWVFFEFWGSGGRGGGSLFGDGGHFSLFVKTIEFTLRLLWRLLSL